MCDALTVESLNRKKMPHPLTELCLEVVWSSICPNLDTVEELVEFLDLKQEQPNMKDKMIVILVGL